MFDGILRDMLDRVPGARGVIFCDPEGETVSAVGAAGRRDPENLNDYELRVTGAQLSGPMEQALAGFGPLQECVISCQQEKLLVHILPQRYFLVLCLEPSALSGRGLLHLRAVADRIREEI